MHQIHLPAPPHIPHRKRPIPDRLRAPPTNAQDLRPRIAVIRAEEHDSKVARLLGGGRAGHPGRGDGVLDVDARGQAREGPLAALARAAGPLAQGLAGAFLARVHLQAVGGGWEREEDEDEEEEGEEEDVFRRGWRHG